jgi:drug/metabolite transporter (DMT)-like permease
MPWADRHPAVRFAFGVGKNLLGVAFVLAGVMMLVLPGQGVLTIVVGAVLADFPASTRSAASSRNGRCSHQPTGCAGAPVSRR